MIRSLTWKLTFAFLSVALLVALFVAMLVRVTNATQLDRLIVDQQRGEFQSTLIDYYQAHQSWEGVSEGLAQSPYGPPPGPSGGAGPDPFGHGPSGGPPGYGHARRDRHELFGLADADGVVVVALLPQYPAGTVVPAENLARGDPLSINGQFMGTILTASNAPGLAPEELAYLRRTDLAIALAGGGAVLVALIVGVLLARTLTRPLRALTGAAQRMAGGELDQEVPVPSSDEIGDLAAAFNQMSREVSRANKARRQMTADVAHELRTPLTVISGYVEALRDGVLAPTKERFAVIYAELEHLEHLVGDLRTLSQADAGELKLDRQPTSPRSLLEQTQAAFEHQASQRNVHLVLKAEAGLSPVFVDATRMAQVLTNLMSNALRYAPEDSAIMLAAMRGEGEIVLEVADEGPGIPPESLPYVFDRFYRVEAARAGEGGESGLGLAIAKALVEAHGGTIEADSAVGRGTAFRIHLPFGAA